MIIDSSRFGKMIVGGTPYDSDLIVFGNEIFSPWWRRKGHVLTIEDLQWVIEREPDNLVIGTGHLGRMLVRSNVPIHLSGIGIALQTARTQDAVQEFNSLSRKRASVAGAFHLTC